MSLVKYGGRTKQEQIQYTQPTNYGKQLLNTHSTRQGAQDYLERLELERSEREFKVWQKQQTAEKEAELQRLIELAQNQTIIESLFTINSLYQEGINLKLQAQGVEANKFFYM